MSEVFNFQRFWTYFKYDLKQMWRNHFKVALFLGLLPLLLYIIWVLCSLSFTRNWSAPVLEVRYVFFYLAALVIVLYQARTYGHLTDRQKGSNYLMIPASTLEKFVSMMLMTLVIIPILFVGVYLLLDGLLSLVDPHYGKTLVSGINDIIAEVWQADLAGASFGELFPRGLFIITALISFAQSLVYFLLSGLVFKKWKIIGGLMVSYGFGLVLTVVAGFVVTGEKFRSWVEMLDSGSQVDFAQSFISGSLNIGLAVSSIFLIALMIGVYYRIKTIKH